MSMLLSILELNEVAFMFLTIASAIASSQFGSYIISLFRASFIYSNSGFLNSSHVMAWF